MSIIWCTLSEATTQFHNKSIKNQICIKTDFRMKKCVEFFQKQIRHESYFHSHCTAKLVCLYIFELLHRTSRIDRFVTRTFLTKSFQNTTTNVAWKLHFIERKQFKMWVYWKRRNSEHKIKKVHNLNTKATIALAEHCVKLFLRMTSHKKWNESNVLIWNGFYSFRQCERQRE